MTSLLEAPAISGEIALGTRKTLREHRTTEIRIRSTHRRRKVLTRGGVLAGFVLAMVVYPVFGTITPYADAAESLPGVVKGESPTTAAALLGGGPQLLSSDLPAPSDGQIQSYLISNPEDTVTVLADCDPSTPIVGANGRLSSDSLCQLWKRGESLAAEPATALTAMNDAFRMTFGRNMCLADTYRTLQQQFATKATRGYLAATPGTSLHGLGIAIDICTQELRGATGEWIRANSEQYGWGNPQWAKGSQYEPWHYEYIPIASEHYNNGWGILY